MAAPKPTPDNSFSSDRKLFAILFADIQGYTAMMQDDEDKALTRLSRYQSVLVEYLEKYNGQAVKNYGDGSLCLFENTVDAANCAVAIQEQLLQEPKVPLRIGLHLGDVAFREGDIYGNDVNLASRVESMGVAGSILMSGEFWRKIKGKSSFSATPLGSYQFKNVEHSMEVFALSHGDIIVPSRSELSGKLAPKRNTNRILWRIAGIVLVAAIAYGALSVLNSKSDEAEISEVNREKRLTVLDFENQTSNDELEVYGSMFSYWISRGLMNVDQSNIVNASNINSFIGDNRLGTEANPEFAKATGIDLVVDGRYYYIENKLIAIANLVDISSGTIIKSFQKESTQSETMRVLDELTQEIVGYWAVRDNAQLAEDPPEYDAYVEYLEGMRLYTVNAAEAVDRFETAFNLDTNFHPPLFRLYGLYQNMSNFNRASELVEYLDTKKRDFTKFNRIQYEAIKANHERNYLQSAEIQLQLTEIDPSDNRANRNAAYSYYLSGRPAKAIEVLNSFDTTFIKVESNSVWREELAAISHYQIGNYAETIKISNEYDDPRASIILAIVHMQALIRLEEYSELDKVFSEYMERGIYTPVGMKMDEGQLLVFLCTELSIQQASQKLEEYSDRLNSWAQNNDLDKIPHNTPDLFNNKPFRPLELKGYAHYFDGDIDLVLDSWQNENVPVSNWPDQIEQLSRIGFCHALLGDTLQARRSLVEIDAFDIDHTYADITKDYNGARILAALGDKEGSVKRIKSALDDGMIILRPQVLKTDPFLTSLIGFGPYESLTAPKD